ncbi:MAG: hypothetical protein WCR58_11335 [Bacteroidales bacterium]|jgi:cytochrome oxidase Cu insertion factor (SCO1/SenC/PrrC family)|nr:hypothetical protein [Bacteroidales bacterium]MDD3701184.1 hypothetical protein [Bacteroidales bacterium]MDY0368631.1 hypothetical protein [Bacteroidales bacterium]
MYKSFVFFALIVLLTHSSSAQSFSDAMKEEINIYQKIYDAPLQVAGKPPASFKEFYSQQPFVLALVFTRCVGICSPFLVNLKETIQLQPFEKDFKIIVVSFDPWDTADEMELLARNLGLQSDPKWIFAVTDSIDQMNRSLGFDPVWDSVRMQFDHDALLVGINGDGYITKKLIGLRERNELNQLVASIHNVFSPTYRLPNPNILFSCFNYDPISGKNKPGLGLAFLALPAVMAVGVLLIVSMSVRKRKIL